MQKFTKVPEDTFEKLQLNAGILVDEFDPTTGTIGNLMGATTGGINFATNPSFVDFGEDIDNVPNNTKELKHLEAFDPQMSGTFLTVDAAVVKELIGAADIDAQDETRVIPRAELLDTDFTDLWWIGDYSNVNTGDSAGFIAIHLMDSLNTAGFQIQSSKNNKGQLAFEYHGHYSISSQEKVPFEVYVKSGTASVIPKVVLNKHYIELEVDGTYQLVASKNPASASITWGSGSESVATVSSGLITAEGTGNTIITASLTSSGITVTDTCTVVVSAAS